MTLKVRLYFVTFFGSSFHPRHESLKFCVPTLHPVILSVSNKGPQLEALNNKRHSLAPMFGDTALNVSIPVIRQGLSQSEVAK